MDIVLSWFYNWLFNYFLSALAALSVYFGYRWIRWGRWNLILYNKDGAIETERSIGVRKAETILSDDSDLSVFVKGVASPYGHINIDPVVKGIEKGLLTVDKKKRTIFVDLRRNPPSGETARV